MDLLQVITELRHSEPLRLFRPYEELYHSLTEKELPTKEIPLPGFELNISDKRMRVRVDPGHTAIVLGEVPNVGYCVDNIVAVFRKISELIKIPSLVRLGLRSYWIQESNTDFDKLISKYKRIIYKPNNLVKQSVDIGASFVLKNGKHTVNWAFGPMQQSQLETTLAFRPPKLPKVSTFLDIDYYLLMEKEEVTERALREFANVALNYAAEGSRELISILQEEANNASP